MFEWLNIERALTIGKISVREACILKAWRWSPSTSYGNLYILFYIYKSWVLTYNSFYCISLKCIHPEHVTAFHVDHLQCQIDLHVLFFFVSVAGLQCIAILFPLNILNSNYLEFALCTSTTQLYTAFCICLLYRFIIIFCFIFKAFVLIKQLIYAWTFVLFYKSAKCF